MLKPKDLTTAFGLARLQEEEVKIRSRGHTYQAWVTDSQGYTKLPTALDPPDAPLITAPILVPETQNNNPPYPTNFNKKPSIPIKRLTSAQMQEMREKGLCYYCDEKF